MTIAFTSPVTGAAQTGFTSPTYTIVSDTAPDVNQKAWAVTALGGTQTGVDVHLASKPFQLIVTRPKQVRLAPVLPVGGVIGTTPRNVYSVMVRKGAVPVTGQAAQLAMLRLDLSIGAGMEVVEPEELRAALSLLIGALSQQSAGIGDTLVNALL
jgi:hypothetical protein